MSVQSLAPVFERSQSSGNDLVVLLVLANMANDGDGFAWGRIAPRDPDAKGIADRARLSKSACYARLYALIDVGELRMFRRGHYRSPAYVITIVDKPLDDHGIRRRLTELDERSDWYEVAPDASETPFHLQRSSGIRTISENDTNVSTEDAEKAPDQGINPPEGRENAGTPPSAEMVRNQDNLDGEMVRPAGPDGSASRTTLSGQQDRVRNQPSNHQSNRARGGQLFHNVDSELRRRAMARARSKGAHNVEGLASKILREDRELLAADLVDEKMTELREQMVGECTTCDLNGFAWYDKDGRPVAPTDMEAHTSRRCGHQQREGEPPALDVSPVTTGEGSPTGGASHCANCGDPADLEIDGTPACLDCFNRAVQGAGK